MKYTYEKTEFINDLSDYIFQRLESAYGNNHAPSIYDEENYFSKIEKIKSLLPDELKKDIQELGTLVDNYLTRHLVLIYKIAFLDGITSQKDLADSEILLK